jgi:hypothetical protein
VYQRTKHDKIFIAANASSFVPERLDEAIAVLEHASQMNDHQAIRRSLQNLIPEYQPPALPKPAGNEKEALRRAPLMNPAPQL